MSILERSQLKELMDYEAKEGEKVLSLYLNVDPLNPVNAKGGFRLALEELLKEAEKALKTDQDRAIFLDQRSTVERYVDHLMPRGKTLVMFLSTSNTLHIKEELPVKISSQLYFRNYPVVRPLLEVLEKSESYLVVLLDREKARFVKVFLGSSVDLKEISSEPPVKHRQTSGTDHMRSQMVFQRRAEAWSNRFQKLAVETAQDLGESEGVDGLIISGTEEVLAEFKRLLPRSWKERVVGTIKLPVSARPQEIADAIAPIVMRREFEAEKELAEDLLTSAQKGEKAVMGVNPTLSAINEGRVYLLLYPEGHVTPGYRCDLCDILLDHIPETGKCPYCQEDCLEIPNIIEEACEKTLEMGGKVLRISHPDNRKKLFESGILGAFLR